VDHKPKVLFFSTGHSTRSQIAEGFLRTLGGEELVPVSTATQSAEADPLARDVMKEVGIDISAQHAKEIRESFQEHFAYVVTICDASREKFPVWPFARNILHWSLTDPEEIQGPTEQKREAFRRVRDEIAGKVRGFLAQLQANQWNQGQASSGSGTSSLKCAARQ
jgi:arsenate reductase (thioredoxin)